MRLLTVGFLFWLITQPLFAQTEPALYGTITDKRTGEPLAGATIKVKDENGNVIRGAKSNLEGRYRIALPLGRYTVEVSYLGYKMQSAQVYIALPLEKNFALSEGEVRAPEILVDAGEDLVTTIMKRAIREKSASAIRCAHTSWKPTPNA